MSETDIYKSRETKAPPVDSAKHSGRRRRTSSQRVFDQHDRSKGRRRSKNSGLRRLLHLSRKSENEKVFWWTVLITVIVVLTAIAIWQFWYLEYAARKKSELNPYRLPDAPQSQPVDASASE